MRHAKKAMIRKNLDSVVLGTLIANGYNGVPLRTPAYRTGLEREMAALSREIAGPRK
jgi:hypothetical protein